MTFQEYLLPQWAALTNDQKEFVFAFDNTNDPILMMGGAGSGKSYMLKLLFAYLEKTGKNFGKTSTSGVSAFLIEGQTIHSYAGIGLGLGDLDELINFVRRNQKACERIKNNNILIIDEISMMKGSLFQILAKLFTRIKTFGRSTDFFAGIRVIIVGDLLQLLPIFKGDEDRSLFFETEAFKEMNFTVVNLCKIVRQTDSAMIDMLQKLRFGDKSSLDILRSRFNAKFPPSDIRPVHVFTTNAAVDNMNAIELAALTGSTSYFYSRDTGEEKHINDFDRFCPAKSEIALKVGANVMLLKNIDTDIGLVNGSIGVVRKIYGVESVDVEFRQGVINIGREIWESKESKVQFDGTSKYVRVASRQQIPLKLAWASTVHKLQGSTVDLANIHLGGGFSPSGLVYTALSRVRNLESMNILSMPQKILTDQKSINFVRQYE